MKKIISFLLVIAILVCSFTACSVIGEKNDGQQEDPKRQEGNQETQGEQDGQIGGGEQSDNTVETEGTSNNAPSAETRPLSEAADAAKIITQPVDEKYNVSFETTQTNRCGGTTETYKGTLQVKANGNDRYVKFTWSLSCAGGGSSIVENETAELWYVDGLAYAETRTWQVVNGRRMDDVQKGETLKNISFDSVCSRYGISPLDVNFLTSFSADFLENNNSSASWSQEVYTYAFICDSQQKKDVALAISSIRMVNGKMLTLDWPNVTKATVDCTIDPAGCLSVEIGVASDIDTSCAYKFNVGSSAINLPAAAS